jgi:F-type H+-transporting ATPase subunit c
MKIKLMKNNISKTVKLCALVSLPLLSVVAPGVAFAADGSGSGDSGMIAIAAALAIGLAALGGTFGQGRAISSGLDAIGRNPSASGKVFVPMLLGLALIESLVIISFVVANGLAGKL